MSSLNKVIITALLFMGLFLFKNNVHAATITMPTTLEADTTSYVLLSSSGTTPSVSGFSTDLIVTISVTNGTVKITTTDGLTAPTGYDSGDWTGASEIAFEGSQTDVNNALATLSYQGSGSASTTLEASATPTGSAYNPDNGHYYEYINTTGLTWAEAKDAAAASTFNGLTGYLATITSSEENDFMESKTTSGDNVFIGATDNASEGVWIWDTGPEAGTQFWSGDSSGSAVGGEYNGWGAGEPSGEDYAEWRSSTGAWNDVNGVATAWTTYIIEYGGLDGETATVQSSADITITNIQDNDPLLLSSTPTDNSTGVEVDVNIVLTFDKDVDAESGNITIKKSSDDSVIEIFDVTSDISGSGSDTITINPTSDLSYETEYYILIDATAFDDSFSNSYAGIIVTTTLSFTTEDTPDCPAVGNAATYNAYPTCGVATCNSGYTLTNGACVSSSSGGSIQIAPPSIGIGNIDVSIPINETRPIGQAKSIGTNILMYINSKADFSAVVSRTRLIEEHHLKIIDLDIAKQKIKVEVFSEPKIAELIVEEKKYFDLNNDGIDDISLKFNDLLVNRIDVTIEQLDFNSEEDYNINNNQKENQKEPQDITIQITNQSLYNRLKGKIILQVEEHGEAYYIHPTKQEMYYLGRPDDAFRIMREQGIGITNTDLEKIPSSIEEELDIIKIDYIFANKHKGKIFLQVEQNGEAYYVYPDTGFRYYLGRPADAFQIMRELGLGISSSNFNSL